MAARLFIYFLWMCLFLLIPGRCDENFVRGRGNLEIGMKRFERKLMKKFKRVKKSLHNEVKSAIKLQVREELSNLLRDEYVQEIIRSSVQAEITRVNQGVNQGVNHGVNKGINQQVNQEGEEIGTDLMTCSKCLHSSMMANRLTEYERMFGELNTTLRAKGESSSSNNVDVSESQTWKPINQRQDRRQILVAPLWSREENQFRLVNIHNNSVTKYPPLMLKYVISVAYVSKLDSLYICIEDPLKVIASKLNSSNFRTILEGVKVSSMAVDEEIDAIFLATYHPNHSISRMSFDGDDFTEIVNLKGYGKSPRTLTLDPKTKTLYACNHDKLFKVNYDGSGLTTLDTGSKINAVTLDVTNGLLFYGKGKTLMKVALSTTKSSVMTALSVDIWNLVSYNETVYYITERSPKVTLGAVYIGREIAPSTLSTIFVPDVNYFSICLFPEF